MKQILVTGANGFVGRVLCRQLKERGYFVRAAVCRIADGDTARWGVPIDEIVSIGNIGPTTDWCRALDGIDTVVHLAARLHVIQQKSTDPLGYFRLVNVSGTKRLAQMAAEIGIRRFIYVSTATVYKSSIEAKVYSEEDDVYPLTPYSLSKFEAELVLKDIAEKTKLGAIIVRPPLVYGPEVKGNLLKLLRCVDRCLPLPFKRVDNRRSFIGIENLGDFIVHCISNPHAVGEIFNVADGEDLSTPDLICHIARVLERPALLFAFPVSVMRVIAGVVHKEEMLDRLCNNLQVDFRKARRLLGWHPRITLDEGLASTARWYLNMRKGVV